MRKEEIAKEHGVDRHHKTEGATAVWKSIHPMLPEDSIEGDVVHSKYTQTTYESICKD